MLLTDFWDDLRRTTQARIGLGRSGNGLPTRAELDFRAAHALARDAVHDALAVDDLVGQLAPLDVGEPLLVHSQAASREEYLRRPDLGRWPAQPIETSDDPVDLVVVFADGLSARAVTAHAVPVLAALRDRWDGTLARPVIATGARVALGDHVGAALRARAVLVLIGERPGLSVHDSLGCYSTYAPQPGRSDAERNCVSNVHPPDGLGYAQAAAAVSGLLAASFELGASGVAIKDRSARELPPGAEVG